MESGEKNESANAREHHNDVEAADAPASHIEIDPVIEKRVRRKLDKHVVPLVAGLYLLAFLDRSNIGYVITGPLSELLAEHVRNARIAGTEKELHLSSSEYTWLLTMFCMSSDVCYWSGNTP